MSGKTDFLGGLFIALYDRVRGDRSVYVFYLVGSDIIYIHLNKSGCVTKLSVVLRDEGRVLCVNVFDEGEGAVRHELELGLPEGDPVEFVMRYVIT